MVAINTTVSNYPSSGLPISRSLSPMSTELAQEKGLEDEKSVPEKSSRILVVDEKDLQGTSLDDDDSVQYVRGEPVIRTGKDVSRFAVDIRDDGDEALTFRSMFLGTIFAALGAALCQVSFPVLAEVIWKLTALQDIPF